MDKSSFMAAFAAKTESYTLPNGAEVELRELTAEQRGKLHTVSQKDATEAQALVVAMSCPCLDEGDTQDLLQLPAGDLDAMANKVLQLSGLVEESEAEAEKN